MRRTGRNPEACSAGSDPRMPTRGPTVEGEAIMPGLTAGFFGGIGGALLAASLGAGALGVLIAYSLSGAGSLTGAAFVGAHLRDKRAPAPAKAPVTGRWAEAGVGG